MGGSKFGSILPVICSTCHRAELKFLRYPRSGEDHMSRVMSIDKTCPRCTNACVSRKGVTIDVQVCLPTSLISDATSFAMKHQASALWGIKPSCADLQLVNLEVAAKDEFRKRAYLTVGHHAIIDELTFRRTCSLRRALCCLGVGSPTAWQVFDIPWATARKARLTAPKTDSEEPTTDPHDRPDPQGPPSSLGGDVYPEELTAAEARAQAARATAVEEQQRAYVEGGVLHSTTTATQDQRPELVEPPGEQGGAASGTRTASARFPQITGTPNFLHSNNPQNLQQAHDKRNIGIGVHNPLTSESKTRDLFLEGMKEKVFTASAARKAMKGFESIRASALPKKLSHEDKMRVELEAMNTCLQQDTVGFDTVIKAFVKSEVGAKDKPRPIANHGNTRLYALAKVAYCFEHIMFDVFDLASIKGKAKRIKIESAFKTMSGMRGGRFVENDLSAFEFGISEKLKQLEQEIFLHIARLLGLEDGVELFERVVDDRDKSATWRMTYRDETGQRKTARIKLPQTMRESGDRVTSSGNFFQNLVAWFSFLVDPEHVSDALDALIKFRGAKMFYVSPRDTTLVDVRGRMVRRKFLACFAFEGDDTVGRFEEEIWKKVCEGSEVCLVSAFFDRWGWKAKLVWKPLTGDGYVRFVGYEALIHNSQMEYDGGVMVMTPEVRRLLNTKSWTTTDVTPQELKTCIRIYAASLADGFTRVEPMHAFLQAIYNDNSGGVDVKADKVREYILAMTGELPEAGTKISCAVKMPEFEGGDNDKWKRLLRCSAGDFSDREWAEMCHIGTINVHGADLATCVPATWRD